MAWLQLSVDVTGDQADLVTQVFSVAGALSVTLQDAADEPLLEPAPGELPVWSHTRVIGLFPPDCDPERVRDGLRVALADAMLALQVERIEDRDWSSAWREDFHCMCFGARLWVCPSGEWPPDADAVLLEMDPGLAFGTGTHTTTALCLEWLDAHPPAGRDVIDFGCGSGILAIAALKLGARRVRAVDIDPQALLATSDNATRNGVGESLAVMAPDHLDPAPAQLVIANILANPLIELAEVLAGCVSPQGHIVLTGILAEQAEDVLSAYRRWFEFRPTLQREEWVLLEGVKKHET